MKKIILTSTLAMSILMGASDSSNKYNYEVGTFAAGILSDSKTNLDNNYFNAGISIAKNFRDLFIDQVELAYMRSQKVDYTNNINSTTHSNRTFLNAIKHFPLNDKFAFYGLAGLGFEDITKEIKNNEDSFFLNYGLGAKYDIPFYGIALKSDIRHLYSLKNKTNSFMYTFALAMPLGDKINDDIIVDAPKVKEIARTIDELPKNKKEEKIVNNDDDNDGVINKLDKCPNTSPGVKVNKDGCVDTIELKINFDYNSANVKSGYNEDLAKFAQMLKDNPKLTAVIEAHTDSIGSEKYNQKLSDKRATSVVNELKKLSIDSSRLNAIGYGETQPIETNKTSNGRAKNRRVVGLINQ